MAKRKTIPEVVRAEPADSPVQRGRPKKSKRKSEGHPYLKMSFLLLIAAIVAAVLIASQNAMQAPREAEQVAEPEPEIIEPPKLEPPITDALCKDTDNGATYGTKGICRDAYNGKIVEDQCVNNDFLLESECATVQQCGTVQVSCKSLGKTCVDGACV